MKLVVGVKPGLEFAGDPGGFEGDRAILTAMRQVEATDSKLAEAHSSTPVDLDKGGLSGGGIGHVDKAHTKSRCDRSSGRSWATMGKVSMMSTRASPMRTR